MLFLLSNQAVGSSLVKAQIKLLFNNMQSDPVLAIRYPSSSRIRRHVSYSDRYPHILWISRNVFRSFQVSQNARSKKPQYKQLEGVLRTKNSGGESVSVSHGCADMDKQMPLLLGVSKAVLENVIFCHQEDSNWPLGDSNSLKTNFDAIFSATRYSKALDAIRKLKQEQSALAKDMEADLRVLERDLEQANKIKAEKEEAEGRVGGRRSEIKAIVEQARVSGLRLWCSSASLRSSN